MDNNKEKDKAFQKMKKISDEKIRNTQKENLKQEMQKNSSSKESEKQKEIIDSEFRDCIKSMCDGKLSKNTELKIVKFLIQIYTDGYRHSYYIISSAISEVYRAQGTDHGIEFTQSLNDNVKSVKNKIAKECNEHVNKCLEKLYDHVKLETSRLSQEIERIDELNAKIEQYSSLETELKTAMEKVTEATDKAETAIIKAKEVTKEEENIKKDVESMQKEYITILGVFASIVLTFTGGIAFSTSVLENIANASIYRTIIIALIIGLILFNVVFTLFYYISYLTKGEVKPKPIYVSNGIIVILIIIVVVLWNFGCVERRNKNIDDLLNDQNVTTVTNTSIK